MMSVTIDEGEPILSKAYIPTDSNKEELARYIGKFYSPELETTYIISLVDDTLSCHHSRHGDFKMQRIKKDILESDWPISISRF